MRKPPSGYCAQALHGIPGHPETPATAVIDLGTDPAPPHAQAQVPPPGPSRDDAEASYPQTPDVPKKAAPHRRRRLSQKSARANAGSARLVKGADHRDTHRWELAAEDGTVLG